MWKEQAEALSTVERRVSHAEGRAEVLGEQAKAAASALERAARAEERSEVMCDMQTKLPFLIRAVTGSLAGQVLPAKCLLPQTIKLELEDKEYATSDPYGTEQLHCPLAKGTGHRQGPDGVGHGSGRAQPGDASSRSPSGARSRVVAAIRSAAATRPGAESARGRSKEHGHLASATPREDQASRGGPMPAAAAAGQGQAGLKPQSGQAGMVQRAMNAISGSRSRQLKL